MRDWEGDVAFFETSGTWLSLYPEEELARDAGAEIVNPPQETSWGGYSGYFADPDGVLWEVAWTPHFTIE